MVEGQRRASGRLGWIDEARALGACVIVLLHVLVSTSLAMELDLQRQVVYTVVEIIVCRWAVPAFFAVSGALMLDPQHEMGWNRVLVHVRRMLVTILIFGTVFATMEEVWVRLREGMAIGPSIVLFVLRDLLTMQTWDHLWFVYAMAGVYLFVPAMRWIRQRFGERGHLVMTGASFTLFLVIPTLMGGAPSAGPISSFFWNVAAGIACYCVGGCLASWRLSPAWVAVGVGSVIIMVVMSISGIGSGQGDRSFLFMQGSCFSCLYAVLVLMLLRHFVGEAPLDPESIMTGLAKDSFGVYLIHPLFIHLGLMVIRPEGMVPVLYEVIFACVVAIASVGATRALRHVPVVNTIL